MGGGEAVTNASKALRKRLGEMCEPIKIALGSKNPDSDLGMWDCWREISLYIIARENN